MYVMVLQGLSASYKYRVVVYDLSANDGMEQVEFTKGVRAPAKAGTKTILVSDILSKGKKKVRQTTISKKTFIQSLWHQLDQDDNGKRTSIT